MSRLGAWALAAAVLHGACDEAARSRPPASTVLDADPSSGEVSLAMTPNGRLLAAWQHGDVVLVRWIDPP